MDQTLPDRVPGHLFTLIVSLCIIALMVAGTGRTALAQTIPADTLIERSLRTVDLPRFDWEGDPEPLRSRIGFYTNEVPGDSIVKGADLPAGAKAFRIWHIMPHWPADESGLYIGDIVLMMDGKPIGDSLYYGDEFVSIKARDIPPGDTVRFTIQRDGAVRVIPVRLETGKRTPMGELGFDRAGRRSDPFGDIRKGGWLQKTLEEKGLTEWSRTIGKQLRIVADQDFCTAPFTERPNPWRLTAVTYLHNHPTRVGAYSRKISDDVWKGMDAAGFRGAIQEMGRYLDFPTGREDRVVLPSTAEALTARIADAQAFADKGYMPVRSELDSLVAHLARILDMNNDWEVKLDSIADRIERRGARQESERKLVEIFAAADRVTMSYLLQAGGMVASLADTAMIASLREMAGTTSGGAAGEPGVEGTVLRAWDASFGRCVIGGPGPNRYTGEHRLIIDIGGDDVYEVPATPPASIRFTADLEGNDLYASESVGQGAGFGAIDVLADFAGNDTYRSAMYSQGAGLLGVGVLADFAGDDIYTARWCSQGAAFLGVGVLYDRRGGDIYNSEIYSQAFGYARGFGALMDDEGNDTYRVGWKHTDSRYPGRAHLALSQGFGYGMRPWTTGVGTDGGIGMLSDRKGHDLYASDFFSQGSSYWYALGILHDGEGCDRYTAGQYSQGSGIHLSFGALLDDSGDDMYDAYAGLEQGNAHDWSAGCLEDAAGNDTYRGAGSSQGSALNVSYAWLLDGEGNDEYYAKLSDTTHSQGGGNYNRPRAHGSLGLLLDMGKGTDYYVEPRVIPGQAVVKGNKGMIYDEGEPPKK